MSQARVYSKTEAGVEEVQRRQSGLNARVRQLLILIDGKRSVTELARMMALTEFDEFLALLELKGLISAPQVPPSESIEHPTIEFQQESPGGYTVLDRPQLASEARAGVSAEHTQTQVSVSASPVLHSNTDLLAGADTPVSANDTRARDAFRLEADRLNLARLLQETVGPLAEDLCHRIARASRRTELSELFVASLTVVELMSGRKAADRFVEKMKQTGWEE
jgi:hypothetical protein